MKISTTFTASLHCPGEHHSWTTLIGSRERLLLVRKSAIHSRIHKHGPLFFQLSDPLFTNGFVSVLEVEIYRPIVHSIGPVSGREFGSNDAIPCFSRFTATYHVGPCFWLLYSQHYDGFFVLVKQGFWEISFTIIDLSCIRNLNTA